MLPMLLRRRVAAGGAGPRAPRAPLPCASCWRRLPGSAPPWPSRAVATAAGGQGSAAGAWAAAERSEPEGAVTYWSHSDAEELIRLVIEEPDDLGIKRWLREKGCAGLATPTWRERLNYADAQGRTALYWAVAEERVEIVKYLVAMGASISRQGAGVKLDPVKIWHGTDHGWSPLHRAIATENPEPMLSALLWANSSKTQLRFAAGERDRNGE